MILYSPYLFLIISSKWIKGNEEKEKSSRYYIILFPENIQANNPYSKQLPRPLSSFLMHPFFSPLSSPFFLPHVSRSR